MLSEETSLRIITTALFCRVPPLTLLDLRCQSSISSVFLCVSRPAHDISLEEFDDEDLSEITDDCGIGLNYDSDPYEKVRP